MSLKPETIRRAWIAFTVVVSMFTLYFVAGNVINIIRLHSRMSALGREKKRYLQSIEADSTLIERLKYDEYLEAYARERFHMQRPDEDVYIIE